MEIVTVMSKELKSLNVLQDVFDLLVNGNASSYSSVFLISTKILFQNENHS